MYAMGQMPQMRAVTARTHLQAEARRALAGEQTAKLADNAAAGPRAPVAAAKRVAALGDQRARFQ